MPDTLTGGARAMKRPEPFLALCTAGAVLLVVAGIGATPPEPRRETLPTNTPTVLPTHPPVSLSTPWAPTPWVWLSDDQVNYVAGIVAGEAAQTDECYLAVACNIIWDIEGGLAVDELIPGRWYGWREPDDIHLGAVRFALGGGCELVPRCQFLGNLDDLAIWQAVGWATDEDYPSWTDRWGMTSVCVTE